VRRGAGLVTSLEVPMHTLRNFAAVTMLMFAAESQSSAATCQLDDCPNGVACYQVTPWKWCHKVKGTSFTYTKVNVYNHTKYTQITKSWDQWNYPPNGPGNTVYLVSDGINNANHDIDYWEQYVPSEWYWGITSTPDNNWDGCIDPGGGSIFFNNANLGGKSSCSLLALSLHETGHGLGIGHTCNCPNIMDPCLDCGCTLSNCDGKAAKHHYP
jgi:hypothetical protein